MPTPHEPEQQLLLFETKPEPLGYAIHYDGKNKCTGSGPQIAWTNDGETLQRWLQRGRGFWFKHAPRPTPRQ